MGAGSARCPSPCLPDSFLFAQARRIAQLAEQERLPTMFSTREAAWSLRRFDLGQKVTGQNIAVF